MFKIDHLSVSSIRLFLEDWSLFQRKYIDHIYDQEVSSSMTLGKGGHEILAYIFNQKKNKEKLNWKKALEIGFETMSQEENLKLKPKETLQDLEKKLKKVIDFYKRDGSYKLYDPQKIEVSITAPIPTLDNGDNFLPLKGIIDLLALDKFGNLIIVDHKFLEKFSSQFKPDYVIQACAYYFLVKYQFGLEPSFAIFDEIKKSANRDKSCQVRQVTVSFTKENLEMFQVYYELASRVLSGESAYWLQYIPNLYHYTNGQQSWQFFVDNYQSYREILKNSPSLQQKKTDTPEGVSV